MSAELRSRAAGARRWLFAIFAACTAWLIVQNLFLFALVVFTAWGK